ncbi:hypothetical protein GUITHDRAFT_150975 [Guillardia theta CCMP2712]|uniref:Uncharacterized protein n=1 Tax=Guillardia theta (strain CCMP2712) TaxID=905079 RepID=L1JRI1_GUITC|nr:hypothetical protein GUITHDRAFT_150975 [Guillardia theta CCMP2712]EKX51062.1 hypothetical protein GUITHDRAFT_150975 [Guillardia theta CCMP2712]|eukprot:XP_005838042.1 hypothetical protein GUITHDRAFT_150975 [Guillardia theta CCMP2712]
MKKLVLRIVRFQQWFWHSFVVNNIGSFENLSPCVKAVMDFCPEYSTTTSSCAKNLFQLHFYRVMFQSVLNRSTQ